MKIYYHDLLDFEKFPPKGLSSYSDSGVFEREFSKNDKTFSIKFRIEINYSRWVCSETLSGPAEDECNLKSFNLELIRGDDEKGRISEKELNKLFPFIKEQITFE